MADQVGEWNDVSSYKGEVGGVVTNHHSAALEVTVAAVAVEKTTTSSTGCQPTESLWANSVSTHTVVRRQRHRAEAQREYSMQCLVPLHQTFTVEGCREVCGSTVQQQVRVVGWNSNPA